MSQFEITGGNKLIGEYEVSGNKNSVLKLIPASLIADSPVTLHNVPFISDVFVMIEIIEKLGAKVTKNGHSFTIDPTGLNSFTPDPGLSSRIRASVVLVAPLLVRFGKAVVTPPGGDQIGDRLLDTHFKMLNQMGVEIKRNDGQFELEWKTKKDSKIFLEEASVTATEMGLIMASGIDNETIIEDSATEPHIDNLIEMLLKMSAKIRHDEAGTLVIRGGKCGGTEHIVSSDYIEGGTMAIATAITDGNVLIKNIDPKNYQMILSYLGNMSVKFNLNSDTLEILPSNLEAKKRKFQTRPWPGFPTDLMSPFIVLATQTKGTVLCHDWMYEWRMFFVDDLISMGANIFIADPHRVIVSGPTKLLSERMFCKDIRAGVSLVLASLVAEGKSIIENAEVVDRGYEDLATKLSKLGANIIKTA